MTELNKNMLIFLILLSCIIEIFVANKKISLVFIDL